MIYLGVATWRWSGWVPCVYSWQMNAASQISMHFEEDKRILPAYQDLFKRSQGFDIIGYVHDDVLCHERNWDGRVMHQFEDPTVGIVGLAGAPGHCHPDMYSKPFDYTGMGRIGFKSNMRNAEQHGARFEGECDVSVVDGFAIFMRRKILEKTGGWPVDSPLGYYLYTEWLCCEARRQGYRIRLVGIDCDHLGGKTSSIANVTDDFVEAHRYLYENNRDVLPAQVVE